MPTTENLRRVQVTGGSTFIVSLPRSWIRDTGIKRGESVRILEQRDKSLLLLPKDVKPPTRSSEKTINTTSVQYPSSVMRRILSLYITGYDTIRIHTNEEQIPPQHRQRIREFVRSKLMGTEIVSDSSREMTLQVLNYPELTVHDALKSMYMMAITMHRDVIDSLFRSNASLIRGVNHSEDELDRFNFYLIRQLTMAVEDEETIQGISLATPQDCLSYRLIAKSIERIGDHAVSMARNVQTFKGSLDEEASKGLVELSSFAINALEDAMRSLFKKDYPLADNVVERKTVMEVMESQVIATILAAGLDRETSSSLSLTVGSISRTFEHACDIAEVVMNLTIQAFLHGKTPPSQYPPKRAQ